MNTVFLSIVVLVTLLTALAALVVLLNTILVTRTSVALTINGDKKLNIISGERLLSYLLENDIAVPSSCAGAGTCGLCKVTIANEAEAGAVSPIERARLSQAEIDRGVRLSCQVSVHKNMSLTLPDDVLNAERSLYRVVSTKFIAPLIKEIVLEESGGNTLSFTPGDFVEVTAPTYRFLLNELHIDKQYQKYWANLNIGALEAHSESATSRAYSIASRPCDKGQIVLLIRLALPPPADESLLPPGKVSSWLFSRHVGDELELSGPFGSFHIQPGQSDKVMIGGGVGMAPLRAITHAFLASHTSPNCHFFYGARSHEDVFYETELDQLAAQHDNFYWTIALSNPKPETTWSGHTGYIHDVLDEKFLSTYPNPENCDYYLCGPPLMMQATKALLIEAGVEETHIFADDFGV